MSEAGQLGPSDDGTVILDIGGDVGALILHTGPELHLAEIEVSRADGAPPLAPGFGHAHDHSYAHDHDHAHRTHVAVRERKGPGGVRYAAIYGGLYTGDYTVWGTDGQPAAAVTIVGGKVVELDWR